ncbi:MAG: hypothetical protein RMK45_03015 [Armatimonadota bacterium]|nr:hypothetical protein [Armatimonadota bacterium]
MARLAALLVLHFLLIASFAQPRLLVVLLHEPVRPDEIQAAVPFQAAWIVWQRDSLEPWTLATGERKQITQATSLYLQLTFANSRDRFPQRLQLVEARKTKAFLDQTLAARLERIGLRGVYLTTPASPPPSPYALLILSPHGIARACAFPSLESMRLNFFQIPADWAVLELKQWDYKSLELLLAEGTEVWLISLSSPEGFTFARVRLSAVFRFAAREPKGLLTSPATRWNGVVRDVDLAASLYHSLTKSCSNSWAGAPTLETRQSDWHRFWNGWLVRLAIREATAPMGLEIRTSALQRSAEWAQAGTTIVPTLRASLFLLSGVWLCALIALWRLHRLRGLIRRVLVSGLAVLSLLPAVAILYAYYPFALWTGENVRDTAALASWLVVGWIGLSVIALGVARWIRVPLLSATTLVALSVVTIDTLVAGGYGVNRSLLSSGILSSEKIFGVNQWFWGYATAANVLLPASWLENRGRTRLTGREQVALSMVYGLLLTLCGLPLLGAAIDAVLPMAFAFGWSIALLTGLAPLQPNARQVALLSLGLLSAGGLLTLGAIGLDAMQPWQRQVGWARDWLGSFGWRWKPVEISIALIVLTAASYILYPSLQRLWEHAFMLSRALGIAFLTACLTLLLGKPIATVTIAAMCVMFALEYLAGGKEWGYASAGNGVAH